MSRADDGALLAEAREEASRCERCDHHRDATQVVFGRGPTRARLLLVGEQPGDVEDREGEPFVGPAGRLLRRALADAAIDEDSVYLTNAVKHFRWTRDARSARRIHRPPTTQQVKACLPWFVTELHAVHPEVVLALGAVAAHAIHGASFRLTEHRGEVVETALHPRVVATVHPSAVLRSRAREEDYARFVDDLRLADALAAALRPRPVAPRGAHRDR